MSRRTLKQELMEAELELIRIDLIISAELERLRERDLKDTQAEGRLPKRPGH